MSLAAINSQYNGLNGLAGYGTAYSTGAYSLYSDAYVDNAKDSIANGYEVSATSNSYANKESASSSSFAQQCQAIEYMLQRGRTDDAMAAYQDLYDDMASNSYYQGYTENEIKTLLQDAYLNATGTTIVNDISANSNSSFEAGMESAVPIIGLLQNTNSADDFIAEATNTPVSGWSQVKAAAGVGTTSALSAAVAAAGVGVVSGAKSGGLSGILTGLKNAFTGKGATGKVAIAAGIVAAGAPILTYIGSKLTNKD